MKNTLLIITVSALTYFFYIASSIYFYSSNTTVRHADAAITLGAAVWNGKPSPVFEERINHAIKLYKSGKVKKLIFTGGIGNKNKISEAKAAKEYAINHGIDGKNILIEEQSTLTIENLYYSSLLLKQNNLSLVLIVSDPLHMKRAMTMAVGLGIDALPSPTETSRYRSLKSKTKMLITETFYYIGYQIKHIKNLVIK